MLFFIEEKKRRSKGDPTKVLCNQVSSSQIFRSGPPLKTYSRLGGYETGIKVENME